jgi:hypothetical protein
MKNYKTLQQFSKYFNITDCFNKRFMKRKGGYVFETMIDGLMYDVVVCPLDKNNEPVIFSGRINHKTIQAIQKVCGFNFKQIEKSNVPVFEIDPQLPF